MYKKIFAIIIGSIFLSYTASEEVIDNGALGQGILLKQKFTHLVRHLTLEQDLMRQDRRLYRGILCSTLARAIDFTNASTFDQTGVRHFVQKVIFQGHISPCFMGSYVSAFSRDMAEYAIDQNPFSYNNGAVFSPYDTPTLPFTYQKDAASPVEALTTYSFLTFFLETLDDLYSFLQDQETFVQNKDHICPALYPKIQDKFVDTQTRVTAMWHKTNAVLIELTEQAQDDYKYTKRSFMQWAQDRRTSKQDLIKIIEKLVISYERLAKKGLWSPL